jgi:hypothetical protein
MWVSAETIYQSLYVTSRGALRRELTACLRTGRKLRKPGRQAAQRRNRIPDMINIAERPQDADDRAMRGHWEGDLMIATNNQTAIGTLVERATGYVLLVHLPDGYKPEQVAPAHAAKIQTLPRQVPECRACCRNRGFQGSGRLLWIFCEHCSRGTTLHLSRKPSKARLRGRCLLLAYDCGPLQVL